MELFERRCSTVNAEFGPVLSVGRCNIAMLHRYVYESDHFNQPK